MKAYRGRRDTVPLIPSLYSRRKRVDNFRLRPLYPGKEPRYPLHRRLCGSQNRSGRFWEEKNLCS